VQDWCKNYEDFEKEIKNGANVSQIGANRINDYTKGVYGKRSGLLIAPSVSIDVCDANIQNAWIISGYIVTDKYMRFVDGQIRFCYTKTSGKGDKSPIEPL